MKLKQPLTHQIEELTGQVRALNSVVIGLLHYARDEAFQDPALVEYLRTMTTYARNHDDEAAVRSLETFTDTARSVERDPPGSMHVVRSMADCSSLRREEIFPASMQMALPSWSSHWMSGCIGHWS